MALADAEAGRNLMANASSKKSPPRPSWCKVADLIVWGSGALSVALKAASLAAGSVIVGAVFINQCGP